MIPVWFKIAYTAFVLYVGVIWWKNYGWKNFLWFSDIAFIGAVPALWLESAAIASVDSSAIAPVWAPAAFSRCRTPSIAASAMLLKKAYDALPDSGSVIVFESLIDDDRRSNANGLLSSLNMLLWTAGGFGYTGSDCAGWMHSAGFNQTSIQPLPGGNSMMVKISAEMPTPMAITQMFT